MEMVTRWSVTWWWSARPSVGVPERRRASECSLWSVCTYANREWYKVLLLLVVLVDTIVSAIPSLPPPLSFFWVQSVMAAAADV